MQILMEKRSSVGRVLNFHDQRHYLWGWGSQFYALAGFSFTLETFFIYLIIEVLLMDWEWNRIWLYYI